MASQNKRSHHDRDDISSHSSTSKKSSGFNSMLKSFKKTKAITRKEEDEDSEEEWEIGLTRNIPMSTIKLQEIIPRIHSTIETNPLVGFPKDRPTCDLNIHGWFYPAHRIVLGALLNKDTNFVIELGSWFGKSTRFICDTAPNAYVFSVDIWDNNFSANDSHYQHPQNQDIVSQAPLFDVFATNCWEYKNKLIPLKMKTIDGLQLLSNLGIQPNVIFIDADHHYDSVKEDILTSIKLFPNAIIVGDDWRYPDVQRAIKEIKLYNPYKSIPSLHVEGNTCWTYTDFNHHPSTLKDLQASRDRYDDHHAAAAASSASKEQDNGFRSLYNILKSDDAKSFEKTVKANKDLSINDTFSKIRGHRGRTLLMLSVRNKKPRIIQLLINTFHVNVNITSKSHKETALHIAAKINDLEILSILLHAGADTCILDGSSNTAEQIALAHGNLEAASMIEKMSSVAASSTTQTFNKEIDTTTTA
mmetsp:Transcript_22757/g.26740  ORF Transcript_22757/g.26740 Transcript_22757/m.26740 type:complete len:473 (-) Transcript_22757:95-1513(-)